MPTPLAVVLVVVMLTALGLRWTVGRRSHDDAQTPALETVIGVVGAVGLVGHCAAMFYGDAMLTALGGMPGVRGYAEAVNGMGSASVLAYAVPAVLVLFAARRRSPRTLVVLGVALVVVGVTMYDGGPLWVHLGAITLLVAVLARLVSPLRRRLRPATPETPSGAG